MASSSGSDESDWEEDAGEATVPCQCLFCDVVLDGGPQMVLEHCSQQHSFDLKEYTRKMRLDGYSCIKLINYIRKNNPTPSLLLSTSTPYPWEQDSFLTPMIEDDPLLQLDFYFESCSDKTPSGGEDENEYKVALTRALTDLESMRKAVKELFDERECEGKQQDIAASVSWEDLPEDGYFGMYTHFSIHETMLKDEVRTETYRKFIEENPDVFKDKVVLDVGCGTGILSMFAARAGARKVFGVDQSNVIYKAMDIIRENGYEAQVTLVKGKAEEVALPVEKVDVIISEWMGYFLLFESMLETVLNVRDKWLKNPANVFPNTCSLSLAAFSNVKEWESKIKYWENVYGFRMSCIKDEVLNEASVDLVDSFSIVSSSDTFKKFSISKVKSSDLEFESSFAITMQQETECHGLIGYFDVGFDGVQCPVHMSTSPHDLPTHWKQTIFFFKQPLSVHTGDLLSGKIKCSKNKREPRSLIIQFKVELSSFLPNSEPVSFQQQYFLR